MCNIRAKNVHFSHAIMLDFRSEIIAPQNEDRRILSVTRGGVVFVLFFTSGLINYQVPGTRYQVPVCLYAYSMMPIEHKHQPTVYLLVLWSRLDGADACNVWKPAHNRSGVLLFHRSIISSNAFSAFFPFLLFLSFLLFISTRIHVFMNTFVVICLPLQHTLHESVGAPFM